MTDLRVAAVQLSSQDDLDKNLSRAVALIEEASAAGARLIVLPRTLLSWAARTKTSVLSPNRSTRNRADQS